ncbi:MAG: hypothetical protein Ct9H300mP14_07450 [Gammaproteobacteria bacterium]|nr:MAG: hypothetical protein Ct9H300mP14_07450 [Gammaproteobacteria bacterium]
MVLPISYPKGPIRSARVVAFEDLGMEAIYEFEVKDMPVTVAVDSNGISVHRTGPELWRQRISEIPVRVKLIHVNSLCKTFVRIIHGRIIALQLRTATALRLTFTIGSIMT